MFFSFSPIWIITTKEVPSQIALKAQPSLEATGLEYLSFQVDEVQNTTAASARHFHTT